MTDAARQIQSQRPLPSRIAVLLCVVALAGSLFAPPAGSARKLAARTVEGLSPSLSSSESLIGLAGQVLSLAWSVAAIAIAAACIGLTLRPARPLRFAVIALTLLLIWSGTVLWVKASTAALLLWYPLTAVVSALALTAAMSVRRGLRAFCSWIAAALLTLLITGSTVLLCLTEVAPRASEPTGLPGTSHGLLNSILQDVDTTTDGPVEIGFNQADLNAAAAAWLSARDLRIWSDFDIDDGTVQATMTRPLAIRGLGRRFLNVELHARPMVAASSLDLCIEQIQLAGCRLPDAWTAACSRTVAGVLNEDTRLRRLSGAVRDISIDEEQVRVTIESPSALGIADLASDPAAAELVGLVKVYLDELVPAGRTFGPGDERTLGLMQSAFVLAGRRTAEGRPAVVENQAAILTLALLLGDTRIRYMVGITSRDPYPHFKPEFADEALLGGRRDLARHFLVSAAIAVLASTSVSDAAGLLKEQFDAAEGGSGFSFADVAADRAGARFAERCVNPQSARAVQADFLQEIVTGDLLPSLDGLPEDLREAQFASAYGSLQSEQFQQMLRQIDRRLDACRLLSRPTESNR